MTVPGNSDSMPVSNRAGITQPVRRMYGVGGFSSRVFRLQRSFGPLYVDSALGFGGVGAGVGKFGPSWLISLGGGSTGSALTTFVCWLLCFSKRLSGTAVWAKSAW